MAVAKTYEKMALIGEPFEQNGKIYVQVAAPRGTKTVRWYTDAEYRRMYPNTKVVDTTMDFDARHAFGFGPAGYITLYKGQISEEWVDNERECLRYNLTFGYYTPSHLGLPRLIDGIEPIRLNWNEVAAEGNKMKPHEEVHKYVNILLVPASNSKSEFQGTENEWLQKEVTVREKKSTDSRYGTKHTYTLVDTEDNMYIWETGAKDYSIDTTISLKMKVKAHKEINGNKVTVVWYCKEV